MTKITDLFKQFNWLISFSERQRKIGRRRLVIVPMWLTGRGELPFSFVGQESTCDWWNTWTWSKHLFFFNRGWYECVYRKSWPGPPPSCPRPALLLLEEINPGVESRDKKKKSSHPTCRILHSAPGSITWPQWNPAPPPSPIISITETAVKQHMKHLSWIIVSRPRPS